MYASIPRENVTPHVLRRFLNFIHIVGVISITNYYREPWKTRYHGYYSKFVFIMLNWYLISIALSVFVNARHDFGEFCMRLVEFLCLFIVQSELIYFRRNQENFYELLTLMEDMARDHGHHKVVSFVKKIQFFFLYSSLFFMYSVLYGSKVLQMVLSKSESTLARTQRIYNVQYPQNEFIVPIYIPGVDTSVAFVPTMMLTTTFFFILAHDLKAYVEILSKHTNHIGELHTNELGQRIYYTDLLRNKYVVRDKNLARIGPIKENTSGTFQSHSSRLEKVSDIEKMADNNEIKTSGGTRPILVAEASIDKDQATTSWRSQTSVTGEMIMIEMFERDQDAYDYFYVKQIVLFQRHLTDTTDKLYEFYYTVVKICAAVGNLMIILVVLVVLYPTTIPTLNQLQANGECAAMTVFFCLFFYCGEFLAECNLKLRVAAYDSFWYKCTNRTRRAICLFMTRNQEMNYFTIYDIFRLEYDLMVRIFKGAYSFLNIVLTMNASSKFT
ncbi:hypothetical protein WDU94_013522 [Cyamophila willieti]